MRIEGRTVIFKSLNGHFGAEKDGDKPYTVRLMSCDEFKALKSSDIETVRIENATITKVAPFEREIRGIFFLDKFLGHVLVGIHWRSE